MYTIILNINLLNKIMLYKIQSFNVPNLTVGKMFNATHYYILG